MKIYFLKKREKTNENNENNTFEQEIINWIKYLDIDKIKLYKSLLNIKILNKAKINTIEKTIIKFNNSYEDISNIYEKTIILYFQYKINNYNLTDFINYYNSIIKKNYRHKSIPYLKQKNELNIYQNIAYVSNIINCINSGYYHLLKQIDSYNWLDEKIIEKEYSELILLIEKDFFKKNYSIDKIIFNSNIIKSDIYIEDSIIWEIKLISKIETKDFLSIALNIALYFFNNKKLISGRFLNLKTQELYSIDITETTCTYLINDLDKYINNKYPNNKNI